MQKLTIRNWLFTEQNITELTLWKGVFQKKTKQAGLRTYFFEPPLEFLARISTLSLES